MKSIGFLKRKKYDTLIFGNGFNIKVVNEYKALVDEEARYIFNMNDFLQKRNYYENRVCKLDKYMEKAELLYKNNMNAGFKIIETTVRGMFGSDLDYVELLCNVERELGLYCSKGIRKLNTSDVVKGIIYHNANVRKMNQNTINNIISEVNAKGYKVKNNDKKIINEYINNWNFLIKEISCCYNVLDVIQQEYILQNKSVLKQRIRTYRKFEKQYLNKSSIKITTNYGNEIKDIWPDVVYLHGKFDVADENGKLFSYKENNEPSILFASTAVYKQYNEKVRDSIFYSNKVQFGKILIYGISFVKSSDYEMERIMKKNGIETVSLYQDIHIIKRCLELMKNGQAYSVTIAAYSENDVKNYRAMLKEMKKALENTEDELELNYMNKIYICLCKDIGD